MAEAAKRGGLAPAKTAEEKFAALFAFIDVDRDGLLSEAEIIVAERLCTTSIDGGFWARKISLVLGPQQVSQAGDVLVRGLNREQFQSYCNLPDEIGAVAWYDELSTVVKPTHPLRFEVGERVECCVTDGQPFVAGTVTCCWYREDCAWAPYQVMLDEATMGGAHGLIFAPLDTDSVIRRPVAQRKTVPVGCGGGSSKGKKATAKAAKAAAKAAEKEAKKAAKDWKQYHSEEHDRPYWGNSATGESTWTVPAALQGGTAVAAAAAAEPGRNRLPSLLDIAETLFECGQESDAINLYTVTLEKLTQCLGPQDRGGQVLRSQAHLGRAESYFDLEQYERAEQDYTASIDQNDSAKARCRRAVCYSLTSATKDVEFLSDLEAVVVAVGETVILLTLPLHVY